MELRSAFYAIPYAIVFLLIFFLYLVEKKELRLKNLHPKKSQGIIRRVRYLALAILVVFIGLRGHIYTDCIEYYHIFDEMSLIWKLRLDDFNMEPGFIVYTSLFKTIIPDYHCWVFFNSLFFLLVLYLFFKKYTQSVILCFLVFVAYQGFYISFNLYRNAIALAFFIISIPYIEKQQLKPFLLLNILGATFHVASLLYIPLYFVIQKKWSTTVLWGLFVIANICFIFQLHPTSFVLENFSTSSFQYLAFKANKYAGYTVEYGLSFGYIEKTITTVLIIVLYGRLSKKNAINCICCNCAVLFYAITFTFSDISILTERLSYCFIFSLWVILSEIFYVKFSNKEIVTVGLLLLLFVRLVISNVTAMCYYDNLLWGIMDINQRYSIVREFY